MSTWLHYVLTYGNTVTVTRFFLPHAGELQEEDLLANDSSVVVVTNAGYIKRMPLEEFSAQSRHDGDVPY